MTVLNTLDFPRHMFATEKPELYDWVLDLDSHAKLMQKYFVVASEQTNLMEQYRAFKADGNTGAVSDKTNPILLELKKMDRRAGQIKNEMVETEARVMTFVPTDSHDTQVLLRFIATVLEFGHKIDVDYLADVLTGCSDAISPYNMPARSIGH